MIDEHWLTRRLKESAPPVPGAPEVDALWSLLTERAVGFAEARDDVESASLAHPRRGLQRDESASFLRAVESGFAVVDRAGIVTLPRSGRRHRQGGTRFCPRAAAAYR
jgi:hypothetical protein